MCRTTIERRRWESLWEGRKPRPRSATIGASRCRGSRPSHKIFRRSRLLNRSVVTLASLVLAATVSARDDAPLPRTASDAAAIDRELDAAIERYRLPGLAVGIVEDGAVVYARTAGVRVAGSDAPITRRTLFKVASNTKSMTTAALARLVEAGRLAWDDPVVKHLPAFRMHDPWVTREMQVRDLLIHNSGLRAGAGDLMLWPEPNEYTRADILRGLPHLVPVYSFRSRYAYDNLLYIVAGEVAAAAGGAPYEALVAREVFAPLGMGRCRVGEWRPGAGDELAQPHRLDDDGRNIPIRRDGAIVRATTMDAAGGVRCSLDDMLVWIRAWVAPDEAARRWLGTEQRAQVWTAHTPMPIGARARAWNGTRFYAYGYGWRLQDLDGEYSVSHTGTLAGMYSIVHLLPDRRSGFVVMINGAGDEARTVLNQVLVKRWTDPGGGHTVARYADAIAAERSAPGASRAPDTSDRTPVEPGSLGAALGTYHDPWLGEATLCPDGERVRFAVRKSPALSGLVMKVGARHLVDWDDETVGVEAWLDPVPARGDAAAGLRMAKVDPDADFSSDFEDLAFTRLRGCDSRAATAAEAGLVDVSSVEPSIELEIRYAGSDNFVGAPVDGYEAPRCLLLEPAANALARVARRVARDGAKLRVFDCYRPVRAVRHFVRWAEDLDDTRTKAAYYPNLDKSGLMPEYIAPSSGHSRGATVDLTLVGCERARCTPLDMGTPWDFFDPRARHGATGLTPAQARNRERLRSAMAAEGFAHYPAEWWHYRYEPEPSPDTAYDVPVR